MTNNESEKENEHTDDPEMVIALKFRQFKVYSKSDPQSLSALCGLCDVDDTTDWTDNTIFYLDQDALDDVGLTIKGVDLKHDTSIPIQIYRIGNPIELGYTEEEWRLIMDYLSDLIFSEFGEIPEGLGIQQEAHIINNTHILLYSIEKSVKSPILSELSKTINTMIIDNTLFQSNDDQITNLITSLPIPKKSDIYYDLFWMSLVYYIRTHNKIYDTIEHLDEMKKDLFQLNNGWPKSDK